MSRRKATLCAAGNGQAPSGKQEEGACRKGRHFHCVLARVLLSVFSIASTRISLALAAMKWNLHI